MAHSLENNETNDTKSVTMDNFANTYATNILFNKMNVRESDKCTFCPDTIYYIEHFFCECPIVVNFWKYIEQKVYRETGLRMELSVQTILFGLQNSKFARFKVYYINHIILVAKMFQYR